MSLWVYFIRSKEFNVTNLNCWLIDWLNRYWSIGWLIDWSVGWLNDQIIKRLINLLVNWLIDWLIRRAAEARLCEKGHRGIFAFRCHMCDYKTNKKNHLDRHIESHLKVSGNNNNIQNDFIFILFYSITKDMVDPLKLKIVQIRAFKTLKIPYFCHFAIFFTVFSFFFSQFFYILETDFF